MASPGFLAPAPAAWRWKESAVNALIEAIDGGFKRAVFGFRNVQDEMQDSVAGLKRTCPVALEGCKSAGKWRPVMRFGLRFGRVQKRATERQKRGR